MDITTGPTIAAANAAQPSAPSRNTTCERNRVSSTESTTSVSEATRLHSSSRTTRIPNAPGRSRIIDEAPMVMKLEAEDMIAASRPVSAIPPTTGCVTESRNQIAVSSMFSSSGASPVIVIARVARPMPMENRVVTA